MAIGHCWFDCKVLLAVCYEILGEDFAFWPFLLNFNKLQMKLVAPIMPYLSAGAYCTMNYYLFLVAKSFWGHFFITAVPTFG